MARRPSIDAACSRKREHGTRWNSALVAIVIVVVIALAAPFQNRAAADAPDSPPASSAKYSTQKLRGKVVWLDEALKRRYGVSTEPDAAQTLVVLEMADGSLLPIVPDTRGRAFAVDERLRDVELELLVRRYEKVPMIQVIRVLRPTPDGLVEIDYWCDVCAIPMNIRKPCECCQGETQLRERPIDEVFQP